MVQYNRTRLENKNTPMVKNKQGLLCGLADQDFNPK